MFDSVHGMDGCGDILLLKVTILFLNLECLFVGLSCIWPNSKYCKISLVMMSPVLVKCRETAWSPEEPADFNSDLSWDYEGKMQHGNWWSSGYSGLHYF